MEKGLQQYQTYMRHRGLYAPATKPNQIITMQYCPQGRFLRFGTLRNCHVHRRFLTFPDVRQISDRGTSKLYSLI